MTHSSLARRYAGVLFDIVQSRGGADRTLADLQALGQLVAGNDQLRQVFETPLVAPQKKRAILDAMLASSTGVSDEVGRLLRLLADRDRLMLLSGITAAFHDRVLRQKNVVPADVVTASPLDGPSRDALATALGRAVGSTVTIADRVDPAIIGGMIARVGSVVFDGSVTRQIERLRERLTAEN